MIGKDREGRNGGGRVGWSGVGCSGGSDRY